VFDYERNQLTTKINQPTMPFSPSYRNGQTSASQTDRALLVITRTLFIHLLFMGHVEGQTDEDRPNATKNPCPMSGTCCRSPQFNTITFVLIFDSIEVN
jgi:hypothetical protein